MEEWQPKLEVVLNKYFTNADTREVQVSCVIAMTGFIFTTYNVLMGRDDKRGVFQMFFDFTLGLHKNPFWIAHANSFAPLLRAASNAFMDASEMMVDLNSSQQVGDFPPAKIVAVNSAKSVYVELIIEAYSHHVGMSIFRQTSKNLRQDLLDLKLLDK